MIWIEFCGRRTDTRSLGYLMTRLLFWRRSIRRTKRIAKEVTGGSLRTIDFAGKHKKPCAHISQAGNYNPAEALQRFVSEHGIKTLNVAGSRGSKEPGLHQWVMKVIEDAFFWGQDSPAPGS